MEIEVYRNKCKRSDVDRKKAITFEKKKNYQRLVLFIVIL